MLGRWDNFSQRQYDDPARRHAALMALQSGADYGCNGAGPGPFAFYLDLAIMARNFLPVFSFHAKSC